MSPDAPPDKWLSPDASGHQPTSIRSRRQFQSRLESSPRCQSNRHIQTELTDFAALDIGHPGLRDPQRLRALRLRQAALLQPLFQSHVRPAIFGRLRKHTPVLRGLGSPANCAESAPSASRRPIARQCSRRSVQWSVSSRRWQTRARWSPNESANCRLEATQSARSKSVSESSN